ncbi:MAG: ABC transporter substrate-binding protein [Rhodospirillaceae bacterium]|nr:ABC transporter substrate-binding protein [Rhodospirillaceae bacterium]
MRFVSLAALFAAVSLALPSGSRADELRIGFLYSKTGNGASMGQHLENGWRLGLEHAGWKKDGDKLGGVPTRIFFADDQSAKVDVALREVDRFLKQEKVQIVTGILWSNVAIAVQKPIFAAKAMMLSTNAGPAPLAAELCNPLFVSTSFVNDTSAEATGAMATKDGIKSFVVMAPNYQAGKDTVAGFERHYKSGKIVETILFKVGEADFQAEISKIRARKPEGVFIFAPGAMGVAFIKQWATSGLTSSTKLYSNFVVIGVTPLAALGDAAVGAMEVHNWNPALKNPMNERFIKEYMAKFGTMPSYFAVAAYDAPGIIARGVAATGGKLGDMNAVTRAIRKGTFTSPRGTLKFNVNGMPIQPYWRLTVVKGADGKPTIRGGETVWDKPDAYGDRCPANMRI